MAKKTPLILHYRRLMDDASWRNFRTGALLGSFAGALMGLGLLILLPASMALGTGAPVWSLSFWQWMIVLAVDAAASVLIDFFGTRTGYMGALGFLKHVHYAVGSKVASLPLGWFKGSSAGSMSRMVTQEMMSLGESAAHFLYKFIQTTVAAGVICIGSWFWAWELGALLTVAIPFLLIFLTLARHFINKGKKISEPSENELAARVIEFSRCQGALRSCNASGSYREIEEAFEKSRREGRRGLAWETVGQIFNGVFLQIIIISMITLATYLMLGARIGILEGVATIGMALRFTSMLEELGASAVGLEERRQLMEHVDSVLDAPSLPEPEVSAPLSAPGSVELREVEFGYVPERQVLRGVSFRVPARSMCALVGPSGCGKTTVARLVSRFYDVDAGAVLVGGVDVRSQRTEDLMKQLSMVFQDVYLFDDTLLANIRVGNPAASEEEIRWAADKAGVSEIAQRLPDGWEARVGEGGTALSGGERQRVSIARALVKRAPIVLFDEATSALDAENEANIVAAMEQLRQDSTLIVIAHKLETIRSADQVVVFDAEGRVAQLGNHEALIDIPGPYQDFWHHQDRSVGWSLAAGGN